jgi:hypothetical protein
LTVVTPCPYRADEESAYAPSAINISCEEAVAVTSEWEETECEFTRTRSRCQLADHDCRRWPQNDPTVEVTRCYARQDPHRAVEIVGLF